MDFHIFKIGDYAILIKSGFSTTQAIRSQFLTSLGGLCGACFGLMSANAEQDSLWILPFTAGGFMYISLSSLIPDMYEQETEPSDVRLTNGAIAAFVTLPVELD